jgi:hypothetical protein
LAFGLEFAQQIENLLLRKLYAVFLPKHAPTSIMGAAA